MKKIGAVLLSLALVLIMATSFCFAEGKEGGLSVSETYPKDGSKGAAIENLGVKVYFSNNLTSSKVGEANKGKFELKDENGTVLPIKVLYSEEEGVVLVLLDNTNEKNKYQVLSNSEYSLTIKGDVVDDQGNTLGNDYKMSFKTLNQSSNVWISILMTVGMVVGMLVLTIRSNKKKDAENAKQATVNPYKEAKKTGKSVEEIVAKDQKTKAKQAAKDAKKKAEEEEAEEKDTYRVKARKSASLANSSYVAKKRKEAQAQAKKAAKAKGQKGKGKGKGKKK